MTPIITQPRARKHKEPLTPILPLPTLHQVPTQYHPARPCPSSRRRGRFTRRMHHLLRRRFVLVIRRSYRRSIGEVRWRRRRHGLWWTPDRCGSRACARSASEGYSDRTRPRRRVVVVAALGIIEGQPRVLDGVYPFSDLCRRVGLEVVRPNRGDQAERVIVSFERDGGAGVHVGEVEEAEKLVFGGGLVVRDV